MENLLLDIFFATLLATPVMITLLGMIMQVRSRGRPSHEPLPMPDCAKPEAKAGAATLNYARQLPRDSRDMGDILIRVAFSVPGACLVLCVCMSAGAAIEIGHWPYVYNEDPKSLSIAFLMEPILAAMIFFVGTQLVIPIVYSNLTTWRFSILWPSLFVLTTIAFYAFCYLTGFWEWFMD